MNIHSLEVDDIVTAPCYFYNRATRTYEFQKRRCFVVDSIDNLNGECTVRSISTSYFDYGHKIQDFNQTGLDVQPSYVLCTPYNLATYRASEIKQKIGTLSQDDSDQVMEMTLEKANFSLKKELLSPRERIYRRRQQQNER